MFRSPRLRLSSAAGQSAAEYLGVLVVIAVIIGALTTTSAGDQIKDGIICKVQEIAGQSGACSEGDGKTAGDPIDPECVRSTSTSSANVGATVAFIEVGQGNVLIKEVLGDGTTRYTLLDKGTAAAKALAGGKLKLGKFGGDWSAEASAGISLAGAKVYEFPPDKQKEADAFGEALGNEGTFSQILEDGFRGTWGLPGLLEHVPGGGFLSDPLGVRDWVGDKIFGEDDVKLPEPTSTYVEAGLFGDAEATGALGIGAISAEVEGSLKAAENLKVTTSGKDKGQVEASYKIEGEAGGQLLADIYGAGSAGAGGKLGGSVEAKVTYGNREDGTYGPIKMELTSEAQAAGNASVEGSLDGKDLASAGQYIKDLSVSSEEDTGKKVKTTLELDLSNDEVARDVLDLVGEGATGGDPLGAASDLYDSALRNAKATIDIYDTTSSDTSGEVAGGAGINLGLEGGQQSETETLDQSVVAEPGEGFRRRNCGQD